MHNIKQVGIEESKYNAAIPLKIICLLKCPICFSYRVPILGNANVKLLFPMYDNDMSVYNENLFSKGGSLST